MDLPGQGHLFDTDERVGAYGQPTEGRPIITARDPSVTPEEAPRLSRQCLEILDRLREGPATNRELATISLKYSGRVSDLRAAGYTINCKPIDRVKGAFIYELGE